MQISREIFPEKFLLRPVWAVAPVFSGYCPRIGGKMVFCCSIAQKQADLHGKNRFWHDKT
ncbi:MAG: hypothetical protein J6L76_05055 [Clostridia bacterium]|nr:hypothetical protein [Clostridia bacterium]